MELKKFILRVVRLRRPKFACSLSYADYRPKTKAVILLGRGHTLRETVQRKNKEREGN
jgi:hypothetical protein